jgi:hypothetical protein
MSTETGMGFGVTPGTDSSAVTLMFMTDLTGDHGLFHK